MRKCIGISVAVMGLALAGEGHAQPVEPKLVAIKAAAEQGDPEAQDKLADAYRSRSDDTNALIWYRKAAAQGVVHAQSELGRILIGYAKSPAAKPEVRVMHADEAIGWYVKAANQGDKHAQLGLGRQFEAGEFIKQDYAEAYKWYVLAARGVSRSFITKMQATSARDALILKMSQAQIAEGQKLVAAFTPGQSHKKDSPEPGWVKEIKLQGLSGTATRRLAIINGQTFQKGDQLEIKVGGKGVKIRCLEVGETAATIAIEGRTEVRELKLGTE